MRTLLEAMQLVRQCHLAWLDPDRGNMPCGGYEIAHDTGRWWDAMLRFEDATGIIIPIQAEIDMLNNLKKLTDNPIGLLMNRPDIPWISTASFNPHNFRETLLALTALIRFRGSDWAVKKGKQVIGSLNRHVQTDGRLDMEGLANEAGLPFNGDICHYQAPGQSWFDGTASTGRALEAVLLYQQATDDEEALFVAERIAQLHYKNTIHPDGSPRWELLSSDNAGHNHSFLGTLRGLMKYGIMTGEKKYIRAVEATYKYTLWKHNISFSGWTPHDLGKIRFPNAARDPLGDHGSCSDVVQLALWLAAEDGNVSLYDDVERLIRIRLLPSQVIDPENAKCHGAWGVYDHPFGFGAILDVFSAVLHALVDVSRHVVEWRQKTLSIHMQFDMDTPWAIIQTSRNRMASITVTPKDICHLRIRIPRWAPRESVSTNARCTIHWDGDYLEFPSAQLPVTVEYALPETQIEEIMPVSGQKFVLSLRGDEVIDCVPRVPIYPRLNN